MNLVSVGFMCAGAPAGSVQRVLQAWCNSLTPHRGDMLADSDYIDTKIRNHSPVWRDRMIADMIVIGRTRYVRPMI